MSKRTRKALVPAGPAHKMTDLARARAQAAELLEAFLSRRSEHTRRAYDSDLRDLARFMGEPTPAAAVDTLIRAGALSGNRLILGYLEDMREREPALSPATRNRRLSAIRSALKLGRSLGMLTWTLEIDGEKVRTYRDTEGPGEDAYRDMLALAGVRDAAILRLLHDLALRRGELVSLDLEHVDLEKRKLSLLGKARSQRELLTIPRPTAQALAAWIQERGTRAGPLFQALAVPYIGHRLTGEAVRLLVGRLGRLAGAGTVRPHGLRHTGITRALERTNGNISNVARFSRHASIETVRVYDDTRRDVAGEVAELVAQGPE